MTMDYSPLHRSVTIQEVDEYRRSLKKSSSLLYYPARRTLIILSIIIVLGFVCIAMAPVHSGWSTIFKTITAFLVLGTGFTLLTVFVTRHSYERQLLMAEFCQKNGLLYRESLDDPAYGGVIFSKGRSRKSSDLIYSEGEQAFTKGNIAYT